MVDTNNLANCLGMVYAGKEAAKDAAKEKKAKDDKAKEDKKTMDVAAFNEHIFKVYEYDKLVEVVGKSIEHHLVNCPRASLRNCCNSTSLTGLQINQRRIMRSWWRWS
jgi:hypothetical protein